MSLPFLNFMVDISRATACGHERVLCFDDIWDAGSFASARDDRRHFVAAQIDAPQRIRELPVCEGACV
jgi:hypothetical protein